MAGPEVQVTWNGAKVKRLGREGAIEGLEAGTQHLLGAALVLVPWDEHHLEGTGTATVNGPKLLGAVSFNTPYARRQHEELDWRHKPGRSAKYLEIPMHAEAKVIQALIAARIRRKLAGR
jgi:hypothetical protein